MSSKGAAIQTHDLSKTYRLGVGRARVREMMPSPVDTALEKLFPRWWNRNTFNALDDVSFSVERGASVGLIGHNGAGKTTLLKVIAGVTEPTRGRIDMNGRAAALIDVMVGFHPELTGRENVYLLGAMYGLGRREMNARLDRIIEFSELHDYLETPQKRYSSGMGARLGFSIMTVLDVDILLVDEVLAVGDASFQRKCIRWLDEFRMSGGTLVFVSHNLSLVRSMTERVVWLDRGKLVQDGPTDAVLADYARAMERRDLEHSALHQSVGTLRKRGLHRWGSGGARVNEVHIEQDPKKPDDVLVSISYESPELQEGRFCIGFIDEGGHDLGVAASPMFRFDDTDGCVQCRISSLPLRSGIYFPVVAILSLDRKIRDRWRLDRAVVIEGKDDDAFADDFGPTRFPARWSVGAASSSWNDAVGERL